MPQNSPITQLDTAQAVKRCYDETNDSMRVEFASGVSSTITLTAAADSISVQGVSISVKASVTSASTGVIIPPFSIVGLKSFNLYTNTTSTLTGPQTCTLQISPSDTDNVWISTTLTVIPSVTNGTVIMGTEVTNIVARRAQVIIAAAITSGTFDIYAVAAGT